MISGATFKNKADIERKILECGGSVVQNPGMNFICYIYVIIILLVLTTYIT